MILRFSLFSMFISLIIFPGFAQEKLAPGLYLVKFKDKNNNTFQLSKPSYFLSSRALSRRQNQQIGILENDLPVSKFYTDSISRMGFKVLNVSKWLNAISIETQNAQLLDKLNQISFVVPASASITSKSVKPVYRKRQYTLSNDIFYDAQYYGTSYSQISMHNGEFLHTKGFRGQGMLVAVMDGGFQNVTNMTSLDSLWKDGRVNLTRDMYGANGEFYNDSHGSMVLSIMAGNIPGTFVGTAPKARYALFRSEDSTYDLYGNQREYLIEEFNWVVAAELADSIGADVINTSLGYSTFNDPSMDHSYGDMNGRTTMVSKGASVASSKGMIVVVSAGNEGADPWKYITAPADADSILTIGAVNSSGVRVYFSSVGPTSDQRIKPEIMATGGGTAVQTPDNSVVRGNGTSFSAPVIAGLVACLWQASPGKKNIEIINAVKQASSKFNNPDNYMGYGIPDFKEAYYILNPSERMIDAQTKLWPNPFRANVFLSIPGKAESSILVTLYNSKGQKVVESRETIAPFSPNTIELKNLASLPKGMYLVRIINGSSDTKYKLVKQ